MDESELEVDAYGTKIKEGAWVKLLEVMEWEGGRLAAGTKFQYFYGSVEQLVNDELVWVEPEELKVV